MASLREVAKDLLYEASDAIAFLVIWKTGRSWNGRSYFEIEYDEITGDYHVDEDVIQELKDITKEDQDAIAVCGYFDNIGWSEENGISVNQLMEGIKFQRNIAPGSLKKLLAFS